VSDPYVEERVEEQTELTAKLFKSIASEAVRVAKKRGWGTSKAVAYIASKLLITIHELTGLYIDMLEHIWGDGDERARRQSG